MGASKGILGALGMVLSVWWVGHCALAQEAPVLSAGSDGTAVTSGAGYSAAAPPASSPRPDRPKPPPKPEKPEGKKKPGEQKAKPGEEKEAPDKKEEAEETVKPIERPSDPPQPPDPEQLKIRPDASGKVRFNFQGQPWPDVLQWLAEVSGMSLDWQQIPGDYLNLTTQRSYDVDEARDLINRHLLARGYTLLRHGEVLSVVKLEKLNPGMVPRVDAEALDERDKHEFVKSLLSTRLDAGGDGRRGAQADAQFARQADPLENDQSPRRDRHGVEFARDPSAAG